MDCIAFLESPVAKFTILSLPIRLLQSLAETLKDVLTSVTEAVLLQQLQSYS